MPSSTSPPVATPAAPSCAYCAAELGPTTKVQPFTVDDKTFCPTCMQWHRSHREPERFSGAASMETVQCGSCGWESLSFATVAGNRRACGHCGRHAVPVRVDAARMASINAVGAAIRDKAS
jgi:hypothetical protein